jgi:phosphonopyruvate decarboxylase
VSLHGDLPYALVMAQGSLADGALELAASMAPVIARQYDDAAAGALPSRIAVLERFLAAAGEDAAVIATTGKCRRDLFTLADRRQHLYQVGSMGGVSAMRLGVAVNAPNPVAALDGDGAALMKRGNLATIVAYHRGDPLHIVLDNGAHDSTGGQATVSASVDFPAIALACGYSYAASCRSLAGFETALSQAVRQEGRSGPALIHIRIATGSLAQLGRPTVGLEVVVRRSRSFLREPRAR